MNVIPIGTLGGAASRAEAIHAATGAAVGSAQDAQGDTHAFLFENNAIQDLTPFPIPLPFPTSGSTIATVTTCAIGLTRAMLRTVVATVAVAVPNNVMLLIKSGFSRGFLIDTNTMRVDDIALLIGTSSGAIQVTTDLRANAMNAAGLVVGAVDSAPTMTRNGPFRAFVFDTGTGQMQILGTLAPDPSKPGQFLGQSEAFGINDRGVVVGMAHALAPGGGGLIPHAFVFDPTTNQMQDLGTLPPLSSVGSTARSINDSGLVVGVSSGIDASSAAVERAFLFDPSSQSMRDLGTLFQDLGSSEAFAIDALGRVVGWSDTQTPAGTTIRHGFLVDPNVASGRMQDLNDPPLPGGWIIHEATGIDAVGQICGVGSNPSQNIADQALLLVP